MQETQDTLFDTGPAPRAKLGGRLISPHEWACVEAGLDEFNTQAGSRLGALRGDGRLSDAATRIGMRARQWPDLEPGDFRMLVRRGFANRWWKGRPTVGVIFNAGLFENLMAAPALPAGDEFDEYLRSLESGPEAIDSYAEEIR